MNRKIRTATLFALALALLAAPACVSQRVSDIVEASNAAMEASAVLRQTDLPGLAAPDGRGGGPNGENPEDWRAKVEQRRTEAIQLIETFIAEHPDQKTTINALLVRKALLHLTGGEPNLAAATFARYDRSLPGNERDLGLYLSHEALSWWWTIAGNPNPNAREYAILARRYEDRLSTVIADLSEGSAIRYYLVTTIAHIDLKWAMLEDEPKVRLRSGLASFCAAFGPGDRKSIGIWIEAQPAAMGKLPLDRLRWYGHAKIVYDQYAKQFERSEGRKPVKTDWDPDCDWLAGL